MIIPNIWENKKWQPNHQPVIFARKNWKWWSVLIIQQENHPIACWSRSFSTAFRRLHPDLRNGSMMKTKPWDILDIFDIFRKKKEQPIKHGPWRIHVCMVVYMLTWPGFLLMVNVTINIAHIRIRHGWGLALPVSPRSQVQQGSSKCGARQGLDLGSSRSSVKILPWKGRGFLSLGKLDGTIDMELYIYMIIYGSLWN